MLRRLLALLLVLSSPSLALAASAVVVIDPGHGGRQGGAVGPHKEVEKAISLEVAQRIAAELPQLLDAKVVMTREKDEEVDLDDRVRIANDAKADVFVSVHCNSMPTVAARRKVQGIETYFLAADGSSAQARAVAARENAEASKKKKSSGDTLSFILNDLAKTEAHQDASRLAYAVHQQVVKDLAAEDRGVQQAHFLVLVGASMPAVLLEMGFISNDAEAKRLSDPAYQTRIAKSVAAGIAAFFEQVGRKDVLKPREAAAEKPAEPVPAVR